MRFRCGANSHSDPADVTILAKFAEALPLLRLISGSDQDHHVEQRWLEVIRQMQVILSKKSSKGSYFEIEISDRPATQTSVFQNIMPIFPGKDRYIVPVDIADWDLGRHVVAAHLYEDNGNRLASAHRVLVRREISPAESPDRVKKVQIRSDGIILLNGRPFLAFLASTGGQPPPFVRDCFNITYRDDTVVSKPLGKPSLDMTKYVVEDTEGRFLAPDEKDWFQRLHNLVEPKTRPI